METGMIYREVLLQEHGSRQVIFPLVINMNGVSGPTAVIIPAVIGLNRCRSRPLAVMVVFHRIGYIPIT